MSLGVNEASLTCLLDKGVFIIPCFTEVVQKAGQAAVWVGLRLFPPSKLIMKHKMACLIETNIFNKLL